MKTFKKIIGWLIIAFCGFSTIYIRIVNSQLTEIQLLINGWWFWLILIGLIIISLKYFIYGDNVG